MLSHLDRRATESRPAGGTRPHSNVTDFLLAGKSADRVALRLPREHYTYGAVRQAAKAIAQHLVRIGYQKGDRVILAADNSFFWVVSYLGVLQAGLICVPLPTTISFDEFDDIRSIAAARLALVQTNFAARNLDRAGHVSLMTDRDVLSLPGVHSSSVRLEHSSHPTHSSPTLPVVGPTDLAALMFTSGSTGQPRGVMVSHLNIMANTESIIQYLGLTQSDRIMAVLPFHYCFGASLLHTHLKVGGSLVIGSNFMYPEAVLQRMLETECTGFAGVPSHFQILLRNSTLRKKTFSHLRYVQQAGGPLAPGYIRELQESLPNTRVFIMYGQTEATSRLSYLPPRLLQKKLGSIGKGIPGVLLRVLNESNEQVRPGEIGEIVAQGENVTQGYWHAPEDTARTFRDGVLRTGDLATVDEDGFIYIVGRANDFVKCGGKRVSCRQLEEQILEFPGVIEAAVLGVPDEILGEAVKVFVVPRIPPSNGLSEQVLQFCKEHFPYQLVPRAVVVLDALPKNSAGKVLKQALKNV